MGVLSRVDDEELWHGRVEKETDTVWRVDPMYRIDDWTKEHHGHVTEEPCLFCADRETAIGITKSRRLMAALRELIGDIWEGELTEQDLQNAKELHDKYDIVLHRIFAMHPDSYIVKKHELLDSESRTCYVETMNELIKITGEKIIWCDENEVDIVKEHGADFVDYFFEQLETNKSSIDAYSEQTIVGYMKKKNVDSVATRTLLQKILGLYAARTLIFGDMSCLVNGLLNSSENYGSEEVSFNYQWIRGLLRELRIVGVERQIDPTHFMKEGFLEVAMFDLGRIGTKEQVQTHRLSVGDS